MTKTRNSEVLADFVVYCAAHPEERFWQALRNWSGHPFVLVADELDFECNPPEFVSPTDTFYWEGKNG